MSQRDTSDIKPAKRDEVLAAIANYWKTHSEGEFTGHRVALSPDAQLLENDESIADAVVRVVIEATAKPTTTVNPEDLTEPFISLPVQFNITKKDWYEIVKTVEPPAYTFQSSKERIYKHLDVPLNEGGELTIKAVDEPKTYQLGLREIEAGLKVMAIRYPKHFSDFLRETGDACTGDVFLQCCLFGEVIYG